MKSRRTGFIFLLLALSSQAISTILAKIASLSIREFSLIEVLGNGFYLGSLLFLALQAVAWQKVLRTFPLIYSFLFMNLIYPIVLGASIVIFKEEISVFNLVGIIMIIIGVFVLNLDILLGKCKNE